MDQSPRPPSERAAKAAAAKAASEAARLEAEKEDERIREERAAQRAKHARIESPAPRSRSRKPPAAAPRDILESFMQFTPTTLAVYLWGDEFRKWQEDNKTETSDSKKARAAATAAGQPEPEPEYAYPSGRSVLELIPQANLQCVATIGEMQEKQPCYICGFPIGPRMPKNGLTAECEHILSVAQAVLLYGLYQQGDQPEFFKREYRWSHELCNQEKSDMNIIKYSTEKGFETDKEVLGELLDIIYNSKRRGGADLKVMIGDVNAWKAERLIKVGEVTGPLITFLNERVNEGGDKMSALLAAATVLDRVKEHFKNTGAVAALARAAAGRAKVEEDYDDSALDVPFQAPALGAVAEAAQAGLPAPAVGTKRGRGRHKTQRMRRCRLPKLL